jgi:3-isopropylmalate/(R)-2-methylmalate dehydratase small subunit
MDPEKNQITVNLKDGLVITPDGETYSFEMATEDREMLMEGLDAIAVTMKRDDEILAFQARDRLQRPWIYL